MSDSQYRELGFFVPFPRPIPILEIEPDAAPLVKVCINEDWLPIVVGALKVLAMPQTWANSSNEDTANMVLRASLLLDLFDGNCGTIEEDINWFLDFVPGSGNDSDIQEMGAGVGPDDTTSWAGEINKNIITGNSVIDVSGHPNDDPDLLVGGLITNILVIGTPIGASFAWTISWVDCLDNTGVDTGLGNLGVSNVHWKSFSVIMGGSCHFDVTIKGLWECGPA